MGKTIRVIYDLETTGFKGLPLMSKSHKIIQISALNLDTNNIFSSFVNPNIKIPIPSSKIHNIYDDDILNSKTINLVFSELIEKLNLNNLNKFDIVEFIAHNNQYFDEIILNKEIEISKLPFSVKFFDTLPFIKTHFPKLISYKLTSLYQYFYNTNFSNAHNAEADVLALSKIYRDKIKQLRNLEIKDQYENIRREALTSIRMVGNYRAILIMKILRIDKVTDLKKYFKNLARKNKRVLYNFLYTKIGVKCFTQLLFIISQILDIKIYDEKIYQYIPKLKNNCFNNIDYYIKYRYNLTRYKKYNKWKYQLGLFEIKNLK